MLLLVLIATAALGARNAYLAAEDLTGARVGLAGLEDAALEDAGPSVDAALVSVDRARARLAGPSVSVLRWTPVLGRSIKAERAVAEAAGSSLQGVQAITAAVPSIRTPEGLDVAAVRGLADRLQPLTRDARRDLEAVRGVRTDWTPEQVGTAVADVDRELTRVVDLLDRARQGAELAAGLLGESGPRHLLIALGNNAELRGTGGYVSTFATGRTEDGRLVLDPFQDVAAVRDDPDGARKVAAPPEYVEDFGPFLADTTLFQEWTMSPDVPDAASVAAAVAGELLGQAPDIVLMLDVPALTSIVELTGQPVVLPDGSTVGTDRLTEALLVDAYAAAGSSGTAQDERRAALRAAAGSTAGSLITGGTSPGALVREMASLARGRHLAVWSGDPAEQQVIEDLGLAGSADPDGDDLALVSVNNVGANKLDYYVDREVDVSVTVARDRAEVVQRVVLHNRAPEDLVPYVAGEDEPGTLVERVEFSIAQRAGLRSLTRDGVPANGELRQGAERTRVHTYIELARGESTELEVRYTVLLVDGRYRLRLLPQPLARDASLTVSIDPADGASLTTVRPDGSTGPVRRQGPWGEIEIFEVQAG